MHKHRTLTLTDEQVASAVADLEALVGAPESVAEIAGGLTLPDLPDVVTGRPAAQGDLLFLPTDERVPHWAQPLVRPVPLVREGNGHRLVPSGGVQFAAVQGDRHLIGFIVVSAGGTATIEQPRGADAHDALVLGPGAWQIRRQAEQVAPNVIRRVVD